MRLRRNGRNWWYGEAAIPTARECAQGESGESHRSTVFATMMMPYMNDAMVVDREQVSIMATQTEIAMRVKWMAMRVAFRRACGRAKKNALKSYYKMWLAQRRARGVCIAACRKRRAAKAPGTCHRCAKWPSTPSHLIEERVAVLPPLIRGSGRVPRMILTRASTRASEEESDCPESLRMTKAI